MVMNKLMRISIVAAGNLVSAMVGSSNVEEMEERMDTGIYVYGLSALQLLETVAISVN